MKNKNLVVITLLVLIALFVGGSYAFKSSEEKKVQAVTSSIDYKKEPFIRDYSPTFGDNEKEIYVVEYIDPECESCALFNSVIKDFYRQYYKDIKLVIRYLANHKNKYYWSS